MDRFNESSPLSMIITTFSPNPLSYDNVYFIPDMEDAVKDWKNTNPLLLTNEENWPNEVSYFNKPNG